MAEVPSTFILEKGERAPNFSLPFPKNPGGGNVSFDDVRGEEGTLVAFVCNHCPFVVHLAKELGELASEIALKGVSSVAIASNDIEKYPQDGPEKMIEFAEESGWGFPYLFDETQEVAHAYKAACTPDFFLFDGEGCLFYAGQFDFSRPGNGTPTGDDLRAAVEGLVLGKEAPTDVYPATGCNIKWKPGNEPSYFG